MWKHRGGIACVVASAFSACVPVLSLGDEFDRLEGAALAKLRESTLVQTHQELAIRELEALPRVLSGIRSTVLFVSTDQGNLARLQISPAFRRSAAPEGIQAPILLIERFATFEAGGYERRIAHGKEVQLFDGFQIDLDTGQIVPDGFGGDVRFQASAERPRIAAKAGCGLLTLSGSPWKESGVSARPTSGRQVVVRDFAGRYLLVANGQWSGPLELEIDEDGAARGRFRSDQTGSSYRVTGSAIGSPRAQITLTIQFPRSALELEGYLWTEGKGAISGTARLLDQTSGFVAVREGHALEANGILLTQAELLGAPVVELDHGGGTRLNGQSVSSDELVARLAEQPEVSVTILADPTAAVEHVITLIEQVRERGGYAIRLQKKPAAGTDPAPKLEETPCR